MQTTSTPAPALPDRPSALIRRALADQRDIEAADGYRVDNTVWHQPGRGDGICLVCLAGAVMARTLGTKATDSALPGDFRDDVRTHGKLLALDEFRCGRVGAGLSEALGRREQAWHDRYDRAVTLYELDPKGFYEDMETLAADLEADGF